MKNQLQKDLSGYCRECGRFIYRDALDCKMPECLLYEHQLGEILEGGGHE